MRKTIFILSLAVACFVSCEKEALIDNSLQGEWKISSIESPYSSLSFTESNVEIQRKNLEPMLCQFIKEGQTILAKENSDPEYGRFAVVESLNDVELKVRFVNNDVEVRLDTTQVFVYHKNL
jgi:hypothetical protein